MSGVTEGQLSTAVQTKLNSGGDADAESIWMVPVEEITETEDDVPGADVVTNGNFSTDVSGWNAGASAVLSWQTGGYLRVAYGGANDPYAQQPSILTTGDRYRFLGRIRSDGSAVPLILPGGGGPSTWTGEPSTQWQYFDFSVDAVGANLSVQAQTASGYVECDYILAIPLRTAATTDKKLNIITRENLIGYPNDLSGSGWTRNTNVTILDNNGIKVGPSGVAYSFNEFSSGDEIYTGVAEVQPDEKEWFLLLLENTGVVADVFAYFNTKTCEVGTVGSETTGVSCQRIEGGFTRIKIDGLLLSTSAGKVTLIPVDADGANTCTTTTGAAAYVKNVHSYQGTIGENIGFYDNGASPYPRKQLVEIQTDPALKHADGFVLTADGAWIPVSSVDGDLMDESASNKQVLLDAGKFKKVSDGTWETEQYNVEYYSGGKWLGKDEAFIHYNLPTFTQGASTPFPVQPSTSTYKYTGKSEMSADAVDTFSLSVVNNNVPDSAVTISQVLSGNILHYLVGDSFLNNFRGRVYWTL